ncbi:hypothetical protein NP233_g7056 [Leucocoprinus birnbaumii]|uniref:Uncharacterized protein n=1 Tax=Leucocoprinus birnbaumii TaxID=56174 RepID=A0AAD5YQC9_9AGAR|nr:hypothetical protein NP233_g7056 [Leucocoprinus birnbaumii]
MTLPTRLLVSPIRSIVRSHPVFQHPNELQRRDLVTLNLSGRTSRGKYLVLIILSGFLGGATGTVAGAYALYHWSGLKGIVDQWSKLNSANSATQAAGTNIQISTALRQLAKVAVASIPFAGTIVDLVFNEIDKAVKNTRSEEVHAMLVSALKDVQKIVNKAGGDAQKVGWDVIVILRERLGKIQSSASAAGKDTVGPLFERIPGFHEHASRHLARIRDSVLPVLANEVEKVLLISFPFCCLLLKSLCEQGKNTISRLARKWNLTSKSNLSEQQENGGSDDHIQNQAKGEDVSIEKHANEEPSVQVQDVLEEENEKSS